MLDFSRSDEWILGEDEFDPKFFSKVETCFNLGNGYLGLRSSSEEQYVGEQRDLIVAGTYNFFAEGETIELPNAADVTNIEFKFNGDRLDLNQGEIIKYDRHINLKTGLLTRTITWKSKSGDEYDLNFERIVSLKRLHTIAFNISIVPKQKTHIEITTGINGRMSNLGCQHFTYGTPRFFDNKYMVYCPQTIQSNITFAIGAVHNFKLNDKPFEVGGNINIKRRYMFFNYSCDVEANDTFNMEKICNVYTDRDKDIEGIDLKDLQLHCLEGLKNDEATGFAKLYEESANEWKTTVWDRAPIEIDGPSKDLFAVRFAQYHLRLMAPAHDNRMNIGAKGITGEGYKGHVFWDSEIFLLPYYIFNMPEIAKSLEEYRYFILPSAHKKASENGFEGAQYPWETAWRDDGEVTSKYQGTDIVTGELIKIWTGIIEIHITADVAFGVWSYYKCTNDQEFMDNKGYEIIFDTAKFWVNRLELEKDGMYHINDVVGPDEYKEHVDDNSYTNYLAKWNIEKALEYAHLIKNEKKDIYKRLNKQLGLNKLIKRWEEAIPKIFLQVPNEKGILPQDDTYLTLKEIDLDKYKKQPFVGGIYKDYNQDQITKIQVSKQADVMVLFYLLEDKFDKSVKVNSFNYYEPHCLHDSSLSLCTHSMLAADIGKHEMAYDLFEKACLIDLDNNNPNSSYSGIHAASCGGIWQCAIQGFGGLRMLGGKLRISPQLPNKWNSLKYSLNWQGQLIKVEVTKDKLVLTKEKNDNPITLEVWEKEYKLEDTLTIEK